ncbi:MAG: hypothetical protein RBR74_03125 [Ignavibacteriaceae bacterium]|jgi:hypothetical protein|nr:hypothetical protein [Ignavibacteriaceae bacterium]
MNSDRRKAVDMLIEEFWKKGYLTLFRKFGTYLPEPTTIGGFEVDAIAKYKNTFAIGITLCDQDFNDPVMVKNKLTYLANRHSKGSNKKVQLFVGVSLLNLKNAKALLEELDVDIKKNIRLFQISYRDNISTYKDKKSEKVLFS